ncbi:putative kxYKxGKxW signal peptide domain protein [Blattamonas nauphoetae]|uniref:KxYKxGKxW signal peptide domain protein n=1 Tax=Blattamonas nauphoetae TaxID=2049346 RepID=A0ABQ9WZE7_9EUKA|nr:putative kxYKxGKxW signal peptide domain protein [Blattamonas nauphoetae]
MQIKQASPIQLKIGQFVSTEQQNKPFNNMIDQCEFCTLLILPESSVEPSNIDSTLTKIDHYHQQCSVQTNYVHSARITIVKFTLTKSSIDASALKADISCGTLQSLINHQLVHTTHSGFDPNVDDRIVLDYNLENTKNCTRTYFSCDTDFASQLTQLTLTKGSLITNASIIDTHSASMPISHARTISRNDTLPDDESDIPTAATLVMSVHSPLASLAARHSALASLAARHSALASLAPRLSALASLAARLSALASLAARLSALASLAARHSALASLAPCLSALASLAPRLSALASLAARHSALASLAARHSALASLAPRLCTLPRSTPLCTPLSSLHASLHSLPSLHASLHSLPSLHASLHSLSSLHASLHSLPRSTPLHCFLLHASLHSLPSLHTSLHSLSSLHASLHSLPSLHASLHSLPLAPRLCTRFPRSTPLCTRFPRSTPLCTRFPRSTPLCTRFPRSMPLCTRFPCCTPLAFLAPCLSALASLASRHSALASLAARLSALAFLAPRLSAPALPTATQTYPLWPCIILSNCSPQCPKPARDLELVILSGRERTGRTPNISQPSPPSPNLLSTLTKQTTYPSLQPTPSQHRQDRNKTALPEIIVRTESVFPLPFNNKANPLSQLTISNEILGGMGNQISLFTKYPPSTTDQPPKLPKHPAHIHNPLNCYQTWRKRRRPFHHHQKSEGRLRRMNARKSGNAEYWDEPPEAHQPHLEAGTISEPLSDIQEESQNEKIPRDWDSYGDTIAETNKAQEEKEKTLVKEAKTELKEENDQLTRNEDTKETTIDSDTQPYHPLNNLSNLLPAILPRTEAEQDIIIDCVEWSLARFDCHSVTIVQTVNRHSLARLISFTRHSLLELPEVKGMGMADELEWLCRVEFIFDLCEAVSKAKDESGTLEADLVDIKPQHTQTRLDAEQLRQDEWEIVVKSILHTHTFPTSEAPNWKCASFS